MPIILKSVLCWSFWKAYTLLIILNSVDSDYHKKRRLCWSSWKARINFLQDLAREGDCDYSSLWLGRHSVGLLIPTWRSASPSVPTTAGRWGWYFLWLRFRCRGSGMARQLLFFGSKMNKFWYTWLNGCIASSTCCPLVDTSSCLDLHHCLEIIQTICDYFRTEQGQQCQLPAHRLVILDHRLRRAFV